MTRATRRSLHLPLPLTWLSILLLGSFGVTVRADELPHDPRALEFFEKEVRPVLVARCQTCHGAEKQKGHLRLDSRAAILDGGDTGPAIVPGQPAESLLIEAINYGDLYQMPPKSKLPAAEVATLTRWVELGAPWPESKAGADRSAAGPARFDLEERARHWSFQPLRTGPLPTNRQAGWARSSIDAFILAGLESRGLAPAPEADPRTLIRRLTFDLIGLPPSPAEVEAFLADRSPRAYETLVERLLASPHYGERWGRHWLDLVRFAETAGHEFDYDLPDAYRYRDYVVRALNADLPYDRFVVEHVAGDLVDPPRRHPTAGFNESILGTGFYYLGEGTHSPVDLREEEAARVDNQIDVLSKTFLGLTVACARCHDHKFDAISTEDYYALSGYLQSSRHQHAFIDPPGRIRSKAAELERLKGSLSRAAAIKSESAPVAPSGATGVFEDFNASCYEGWFVTGEAFGSRPNRPGEFTIDWRGDTPVASPVAAGQAHSGLLSNRLEGTLRSRTFVIESKWIHVLAYGKQGRVNVVIDGFEKIRSPIYGGLTVEVDADRPRWFAIDVAMWRGHTAYLELADGGAVDFTQGKSRYLDGSGFLAVDEIRCSDQDPPPPPPPSSSSGPAEIRAEGNPRLGRDLERYRRVEASIPGPTLALAIADGTGEDDRVHIRGSVKTPGEVVPRRFLEAIAGRDQPAPASGSGRLALARRMIERGGPLLARVMVNRIWTHHFGQGIVPTPDDFGVMGRVPTHPELLDVLAARFMATGWSIKAMHREVVLSSTYRMSSRPVEAAERIDPDNRLLHRMNVRRLEAEAIRDALLSVSGRIDPLLFGPSVPPYLTSFMEGRGRPASSGPLDGDGRRSLYLNVRRNFLSPMFLAFDAPAPFSTMGRRNVSNVPAQALTLLNDPFVIGQAALWATRHRADGRPGESRRESLTRLYLTAFGRPPTAQEAEQAEAFLDESDRSAGAADDSPAWADLCHVLMNVKEFIYVD